MKYLCRILRKQKEKKRRKKQAASKIVVDVFQTINSLYVQ